MSCRWITKNNKIVGALTQSGERSKLFDDLQKQFPKEDAVAMYAVSQSDDFQEISTEEPTVENLLRYVANQNRTEEKLTKEQLVDLQDFSNFDREKLFDAFYNKSGMFLVDENKLTKSGLYSAYEAGTIANDTQLQDRIKNSLERLKNTSEEELQLVEPGERSKINEFNSFGKLATIDAVSDAQNDAVKEAEVFVEVNGEIRQKRNVETELILTITAKQTENSKVSDLNNLPLSVLQNNEETTREVLDEIENELIKDSIDVIGLTEKPIDENLKDFIAVLDRFIKDPTAENTKDFADKSDEYFSRDLSPKKENIEGENNKEYVKLETTLSEEEIYNQQGLIKLDDNTYIKTAKEDLTTLYENLRTYTEKYPKNKSLEQHVQEQLKDYSYTNAEIAEAIILYKMYFGVNSIVVEDIKEVTIAKTESSNPSFSDMQTLTIDGGKMEIGLINGRDIYSILELKVDEDKRRQGRAEKLIKKALFYTNGKLSGQASNDASVALNYKLGMRAYNKADNTELSLEETKIQRDNSAGESIRMLLPLNQKAVTPTKQISNFTGNYNYLTEEFPSDFYSKFLAEKKKNSKLFRNFYSNFEINEKGINLINKSETALRNIKIYADENLQQYSLISRQMPDLIEAEQSITNPRVEAVNNPQKVKESKENLYKLNDQEVIIKNETKNFVKVGNDIYESVVKQGNLNHFVKLETPNSDYYTVEVKSPQTSLKLSDYSYLNETPENFKSVKDFLKGENPEELNC